MNNEGWLDMNHELIPGSKGMTPAAAAAVFNSLNPTLRRLAAGDVTAARRAPAQPAVPIAQPPALAIIAAQPAILAPRGYTFVSLPKARKPHIKKPNCAPLPMRPLTPHEPLLPRQVQHVFIPGSAGMTRAAAAALHNAMHPVRAPLNAAGVTPVP